MLINVLLSLLMLVGALFLGLLSVVVLAWGASRVDVANRSRQWPTCGGVIIESRIVSNKECSRLPGWHPVIRYQFVIDDQKRESEADDWRAGDFRYYTKKTAQRLADRFPVGRRVDVRYDPEPIRPEAGGVYVTVLRPGWDPAMTYVVGVMVGSALVPVGIFVWAVLRLL
jgi:hypothetical protein